MRSTRLPSGFEFAMIRMTGTWKDYDEQVLKELGYAFVSDPSYSQGYFIEPLDQTERSYQYYLENDIRYSYSYADFKDGDKVTAIGIQDGQTMKKSTWNDGIFDER